MHGRYGVVPKTFWEITAAILPIGSIIPCVQEKRSFAAAELLKPKEYYCHFDTFDNKINLLGETIVYERNIEARFHELGEEF